MDSLPPIIRNSRLLTGNQLAQLANVHEVPTIDPAFNDAKLRSIFQYYAYNPEELEIEIFMYAIELLDKEKTEAAWQVLLTVV